MRLSRIALFLVTASLLLAGGCQRDIIEIPETPDKALIPTHRQGLPRVYIETPKAIVSKLDWVELSTIRIEADVNGRTVEVYKADSLKIKGRGNSTWFDYPKKPYSLKLKHKANLLGTGKTTRWALLANWMDRTKLRTPVAFEAARHTSMEWAPSGIFVALYLNKQYQGLYYLCERIHVEGSNFLADYLYSLDTSDSSEWDFYTLYGRWKGGAAEGEMPVEVKYPDRDKYEGNSFAGVISQAESALHKVEKSIYEGGDWAKQIDLDSFCDWYLVHEVCGNVEPRHPKSCFFFLRDGKLYAGPVWDFDWNTFLPDQSNLLLRSSLWYHKLWEYKAFTRRLKERWMVLKPGFESLSTYIDAQAAFIREEESRDHEMWPCYPNPLSEDGSGYVNQDERMSFDDAVATLKTNLIQRISYLDAQIRNLQ